MAAGELTASTSLLQSEAPASQIVQSEEAGAGYGAHSEAHGGLGHVEHEHEEVSRLELLSDAVFSIIATISVLPVMESLKEEDVPEFGDIVYYLYVYFLVFYLVAVKYRMHCSEFRRAANIGGILTFLSLTYIGLLAMYPFLTSLLVQFPSSPTPAVCAAGMFVATETAYISMVIAINWHTEADRRTGLYLRLHPRHQHRLNFLLGAAAYWTVSLILGVLMLILAYVSPAASFSVYFLIPISHRYARRAVNLWNVTTLEQDSKDGDLDARQFLIETKKGKKKPDMSLERVAAFTDGVFAISITLVAVNIRAPEASSTAEYDNGWDALAEMLPQFTSYAVAFVLLAYLWHLNRITLSCLKTASVYHFWFNMLGMVSIGLVPAAVEEVLAYEFESYAVALACFVFGLYATSQIVLWFSIHRDKSAHNPKLQLTTAKIAYMYLLPALQLIPCLAGMLIVLLKTETASYVAASGPLVAVAVCFLIGLVIDHRLLKEENIGIRSLPKLR